MNLKPKKKLFKEFIKNAYKENKLIKDILAALYKQKGCKVYY
jgi:poly(3-hydroxyalkanoate) synthetase